MTASEFRDLALSQAGAVESSHMGHADFRVGGKVFATLGYPDNDHAVVMLSPDEQEGFVAGNAAGVLRSQRCMGQTRLDAYPSRCR